MFTISGNIAKVLVVIHTIDTNCYVTVKCYLMTLMFLVFFTKKREFRNKLN